MKVYYVIRNFGPVGGHKVMLQHVQILKQAGIDSKLFVLKRLEIEELADSGLICRNPEMHDLKDADILVFTKPSDIQTFYKRLNRRGPVLVHFCQGYEPIDLMARITEESVPEKYQSNKFLPGNIRFKLHKLALKRKIRKIEKIYEYNTKKMAVSQHLKELLERNYAQKCYHVPNGIDRDVFYPKNQSPSYHPERKIKILSVGAMNRGVKDISAIMEAVGILKNDSVIPIEFIRVSPLALTQTERQSELIDRYYIGVSELEMAQLYREAHIFVSSSLEGEGFGLPPVEAMSCGTPCILTQISSYMNFDQVKDYAFFVEVHEPKQIAEGIEKIVRDEAFRQHLRQRGFEIAENFSLQNTANHLLAAISEFHRTRFAE